MVILRNTVELEIPFSNSPNIPRIKIARGQYKYLSEAKLYDGANICKKGRSAKKKAKLKVKTSLPFLFLINKKNGTASQKIKNRIQKIEYGAVSFSPSCTNNVWSIERVLG